MRWSLHHGDILDVPADVLVCSANIFLNLSGGVGGAFLLRFGPSMQEALHRHLSERGIRHVERGDVIAMPSCGSPYRTVLHAVAVDGAYESSPEVIASVMRESLLHSANLAARTVALTAVGTGYGRLSMADFAKGLAPMLGEEFPPIEQVVIGLRSRYDVEELIGIIPQLERV